MFLKILAILMIYIMPMVALAGEKKAEKKKAFEMTEDNTIVLRGEVTSRSVSKVIKQIYESKDDEIFLFISSPGGSIIAGNQLAYVIKNTDKKVTCVANIAASMAFVILQACERRVVLPHSIVMQHVAYYGLEGEAPNNMSRVKFLHRMLKAMDMEQANRLKMDLADFRKKTRNDWWMFGKEAVENGAADEVGAVSCSPDLTRSRIRETVQVFIFSIEVEWSACPLVEYPVKIGKEETMEKIAANPRASKEFLKLLKTIQVRDTVMEWFSSKKNPFSTKD